MRPMPAPCSARSSPYALARMSESQVDQIQKVFDASVVNPDVASEERRDRQEVDHRRVGRVRKSRSRLVEKADRVREQGLVPVDESDKRIRLDALALMAPDALTPRTDNPDETDYLGRVKATLESRGVYLRIATKLVRDPEDPSHHIYDPRQFEAWLSLGPNGDTIPTPTGGSPGRDHRDHGPRCGLLRPGRQGPDPAGDRPRGQAPSPSRSSPGATSTSCCGRSATTHSSASRRSPTSPVAPSMKSISSTPYKLVLRATQFNTGGNVGGAQPFLVVAAGGDPQRRPAARAVHR